MVSTALASDTDVFTSLGGEELAEKQKERASLPRAASAHRLGSLRSWEVPTVWNAAEETCLAAPHAPFCPPRLQPRALQRAGMTCTYGTEQKDSNRKSTLGLRIAWTKFSASLRSVYST